MRRGFTIIEVLSTLVLIGIVVPAAMRGVSLATSAGSIAKRTAEASALAESKLDELIASGEWRIGSLTGDFGEGFAEYRWVAQAREADSELTELSVEVLFESVGRERSVSLTTLVWSGGAP